MRELAALESIELFVDQPCDAGAAQIHNVVLAMYSVRELVVRPAASLQEFRSYWPQVLDSDRKDILVGKGCALRCREPHRRQDHIRTGNQGRARRGNATA